VSLYNGAGERHVLTRSQKGSKLSFATQLEEITGKPLEVIDKQKRSSMLGPKDN